nr:YusG family protein [Bacillus subtilis]
MAFDKQKLDVTNDVTVLLSKWYRLSLYHDNEMIYQMTSMNEYELKPGYSFENEKFYKTADVVSGDDAKYVDCDYENGWC